MRCKDCRNTGFTLEGFTVDTPRQPDPAADSDELAQWILSITSCSHPNASAEVPPETDTSNRTVAAGSEGGGLVQGTPGPETTPEGGPGVPASGGAP